MIGVCQHITSQKVGTKMPDSLLPSLMLEIAAAETFETALSLTVQRICQATDWDYAEVWIPNANGTYLQCSQAEFRTDSEAITQFRTHSLEFIFPRNIGWPGRLWEGKISQWYADVSQLPEQVFPRVKLAKQVGIRTGFGIPVLIENNVVAVFLFFMFKSTPETSDKIEPIKKSISEVSVLLHHKQTEQRLQDSNEKYRSIFENAVEGIFQTTADGRYVTVNPMLARIYGYISPEEMMANLTDIEHQLYVDSQRRADFRDLLQKQDAVWGFESEIYRKNGEKIWISECARRLRNSRGDVIGYEGTVVDITQRKQAEIELLKRDRLLEAVAEAMNELLLNQDRKEAVISGLAKLGLATAVHRVYICTKIPNRHQVKLAHPPILVMEYEWTADGVVSAKTAESVSISADSNIFRRLLTGETVTVLADQISSGDRQIFSYADVVSSLLVPIMVNGEFFGYVGFDDCETARSWSHTEASILVAIAGSIGGALQRHQQEALIHYQAFHDLLTGLPNRQQLERRLPEILTTAQQQEEKVALMFVDLDRFKIINDTLGHPVGDQLLQIAAERLQHSLREHDMIVRWGGDEFIVILNQIMTQIDTSHIAQRIVNSMQRPFHIDRHQLHVSCSIGIALYPEDGIDPPTLMQNADLALYRVKETGRNGYEFYNPYMNSQISQSLLLENDAEAALKQQEFRLSYQPLIDLKTSQVTGLEALLRWDHPQQGLLEAEKFIPALEKHRAILSLGRWVLATACVQTRVWQKVGLPPVRMWVNLSTPEFHQQNLLGIVTEILQETGISPEWLGFEINEATVMKDLAFTTERLHQLAEMGIAIGLDNFGSGFISLMALKNLPFERVKLARFFVKNVADNPQDVAILRTMIDLGHQFGFQAIVQGIETQAQQDVVLTLDCEQIQGKFVSPPLFPGDAMRLFKFPV